MNRHFFEAYLGGFLGRKEIGKSLNRVDPWVRRDALVDLGDR